MCVLSTNGVLIQDPGTGKSFQVPAEKLEEFAVEGEPQVEAGVTTMVLPGDDLIEEVSSPRIAMIQTGS